MGLVGDLRKRGAQLAGDAATKLLADEKRAKQLGEALNAVMKGRKAIDDAQEKALRSVGIASSGDLKAAGKRLALLRKSARKLDEKLGMLAKKVEGK
jgi:hypothetical protein